MHQANVSEFYWEGVWFESKQKDWLSWVPLFRLSPSVYWKLYVKWCATSLLRRLSVCYSLVIPSPVFLRAEDVYPRTGHEDPQEEYMYSSTVCFNLGASWGGEGCQRQAPTALPRRKRPSVWAPESVLTGAEIPPSLGFDHRTVQPVGSRCTDWAISAHTCRLVLIILYRFYGQDPT